MTTYKYKDGDKELFANEMDEVENVSYVTVYFSILFTKK